jgi:KaiC/GvpD/RAD55 family RecA-like ATPase
MTELMRRLRRSSRTLLARNGHPGPGPGHLALVMSRAGVGKTAFLVGIGIDSLLAGQRVLHVSRDRPVDRVRDRYDEILHELLRGEPHVENPALLQLKVERRRHIHSFLGDSFTIARLRNAIDLLVRHVDFRPEVVLIDRMDIDDGIDTGAVEELRQLARQLDAEIWMTCRTHRDGPQGRPGHLPPPAEEIEHLVDLCFRLDPHDDRVRLHVLKDREQMLDKDMHIELDPNSLLLVPVHGSSLKS